MLGSKQSSEDSAASASESSSVNDIENIPAGEDDLPF